MKQEAAVPESIQNDLENGLLLTIPLDDLQTYHANPRIGNVGVIKESLRTNGQFRPILVNRGTLTGRENEILAGNHTFLAARELNKDDPSNEEWQSLECYVVDVDADQATRIVLADNRTAELGTFDDLVLLEELGKLDSTEGTGYDPADLMALEDILKGAPSLDELEEEAGGELTEEDFLLVIKISVEKSTALLWSSLAGHFGDQNKALVYLFSLLPDELKEQILDEAEAKAEEEEESLDIDISEGAVEWDEETSPDAEV
jgi:ParB-like chromosome segregation protein Spo0J